MADYSGRKLGKYQLLERLGRGGMAEVYKAYHPNLDRFVAVKILHPHLSDASDFIGRFRREAQAVAQLHHPHIVQVFDFDVEGDLHYMVMEYVQGRSLTAVLDDCYQRSEHLPLDEVVRLFRALLDAVGYAHAHGMVHRDLKPANVMLDKQGRPVLTDFGIAKIVGANKLTATGVTVGTPAYMSPEQGGGESGDERSDLYALGIILYECLTGQVPYDGDTSVAVLLKHISAPIPSLHTVRPDLPRALDPIIATAMAKDPDERYPSARAMWEAIEGLVPSSEAPTEAISVGKDKGKEEEKESELATRPRQTKIRIPQRPTLSAPRRPFALGVTFLSLIALLAAGLFLIPRLAGPSPAAQAVAEGQQRLLAGEYQLAADSFSAALQAEPQNVAALLGQALAYEQLGQVSDALANLEQVILLTPDDHRGYQERARLTLQYGLLANPASALADFDRALELAPEAEAAHVYYLRGWAILNFPLVGGKPNPEAALPDLRQAVSLDPGQADSQLTLAQALLAVNQPFDALPAANRAVELQPDSWIAHKLRAHIQFVGGDFNAARDDLTSAINLEDEPTAQAALYSERAYLNLRLNSQASALADLDQALQLAPGSPIVAHTRLRLDPELPRPEPAQIEEARSLAPDDPIWQAILNDLTAP